MKPFSFIAKPEEALQIDESLGTTEPKSFNANLNVTPQPFEFRPFNPFNPLDPSIAKASKQSPTIEFEARLKADGINLHEFSKTFRFRF